MKKPALLTLLLLAAGPAFPLEPSGVTAAGYSGCANTVPEQVVAADPGSYLSLLDTLGPGDLLQLAAGTYSDGLPLQDLEGEEDRCIVIEGPASGPPALFTGRNCCNTVSLRDVSYLVIRHLELDGLGRLGDGVKAEGDAQFVHHLTLEDLTIRGHGADQQIVGINSKCPAWNWLVRRNVIEAAGTGMYFGDSDGEAAFVHSLVEHNLVLDTLGYNLQVKHQNSREVGLGAPAAGVTVLRHNVFSKAQGAAGGGNARPNLLVGHWPLSGPGSDDDYLIYGNFFYQNPTEALFQGEGNVVFYDNLLVNDAGPAVHIQPHNDVPKRIRLVQNTVVAGTTGLAVTGGDPGFAQLVAGNAVFAATPLSGGEQLDNVADSHAAAGSYLTNPDGQLTGPTDRLDLFPLPGQLAGAAIDLSGLTGYAAWNEDFNATPRPGTFRGAYAGEGVNPGWTLALERKPEPAATAIFSDGFESGDLTAWSSAQP